MTICALRATSIGRNGPEQRRLGKLDICSLLIVLLSAPLVANDVVAQRGATLLESCEVAFDKPRDVTNVDSTEKEACCACYIEAVSTTQAYFLQNVLSPLIESNAISSRELRKNGWPSMDAFQKATKFHCPKPDDDSSLANKMGIVTEYLKNYPARLDESAAVLVLDALSAAFPCHGDRNNLRREPSTQSREPPAIATSQPAAQPATRSGDQPKTAITETPRLSATGSSKPPKTVDRQSRAKPHEIRTNWRLLQEGMAEDEVKALLGNPMKIDIQSRHNRAPRAIWHYSSDPSNARVTFREGRIRRLRDWRKIWLVQSWDEPD